MGRSRRSEYPSLGREGLVGVVKAIRDATSLPSRPSCDQVIEAYADLFERTFAHLSVMVGAKGALAIAQRAIKRAKVHQPALAAVEISEARIVLDGLRNGRCSAPKLQEEIEHLYLMTMDVLASLIGLDLLTTVLQRLTSRQEGAGP